MNNKNKESYVIRNTNSVIECSDHDWAFRSYVNSDKQFGKVLEFVAAGKDSPFLYLELDFDLEQAIDRFIDLNSMASGGFVIDAKTKPVIKGLKGLLLSLACKLDHLTFSDEL